MASQRCLCVGPEHNLCPPPTDRVSVCRVASHRRIVAALDPDLHGKSDRRLFFVFLFPLRMGTTAAGALLRLASEYINIPQSTEPIDHPIHSRMPTAFGVVAVWLMAFIWSEWTERIRCPSPRGRSTVFARSVNAHSVPFRRTIGTVCIERSFCSFVFADLLECQ